jgi:3-oxoacyl-[acyl-carrier protein] reductase
MSSIAGVMGNAGQANYSAAKAGLIGFTKSLAKELASRNIRVNAIAPGFIQTDMTKDLPTDKIVEHIPLKKLGTVEDIAKTAKFLALEGTYITGQILGVDGGLVI